MVRHRLTTLACVLALGSVLGSGLAAPAPTTAAAAPQVGFISVIADPEPRFAAGPVRFEIALSTEDGAGLGSEPVELQVRESGATGFTSYPATSDPAGVVVVRVPLRYNADYRWHHPATARGAESTTPVQRQLVGPRVSARVSDRTLRTGRRLVVRGTVFPAKPGRIVRLWSGAVPDGFIPGTPPTLLARARVAPDGSYRLERVFQHPGRRRLFVTVPASSRNGEGVSGYRYVRVR